MINRANSTNSPHAPQPKAPTFREKNAVCIEIPKPGAQSRANHMPQHTARDRFAQMTYFAQSIGQSMPASRPDTAHLARYVRQTPKINIAV